jgi:hypothetical protein
MGRAIWDTLTLVLCGRRVAEQRQSGQSGRADLCVDRSAEALRLVLELGTCYGEEAPLARHTFQFAYSAFVEFESGTDDEVAQCPGD